ncbi:hypothetical protein [Hyphococcus sp.]|uniref:hypothetical protein n=1 Tax=Hyphococcus sp. TaxID=2038636 RepID=UPI0020820080|nr:MAG: hypothetical protein DHS20C04_00720 [Marinicaulis sp.]
MKFSNVLLTGVAALALVSCGKKENSADAPRSESSQLAAKADGGSPLDAKFSLKDGEPVEIDALFALMPEGERPSYESAKFDEKLGATVVQNLRFADADDGEAVIVSRAEFYGVDMDAIERVRGAQKAGSDAPFETIFQKVRFLNIASEGHNDGDEETKLIVAGVEFDKLDIRQGGVEGDGVGAEGARFFNAVNLAGLYFKGLKVEAHSPNAPSVSMDAPDLRFVGLGGGKLGAIIAKDFGYSVMHSPESLAALRESMGPQGAVFITGPLAGFIAPESQRVNVEALEWRGIDLSGLLAWGIKGEKPPATERDLIDLGTMKASNMSSIVNGKPAASVAEATISAADFTWMIPSNFRADSKGAVYNFTAYVPESEADALKILKDHGLDKVKGDGSVSWIWNDKSGAADFSYAADMESVANLSATLGFSNLKLDEIAAAMEDGETNAFASKGAFKNLSVKIKDEKALDAIFSLAALQMGGTGEDLRMSVPAMIRLSGAQAAQMNPRISGYVDALAEFVSKGGTLEIAAAPAEPVAFTALQATSMTAPQTVPDVLDLNVTHKP